MTAPLLPLGTAVAIRINAAPNLGLLLGVVANRPPLKDAATPALTHNPPVSTILVADPHLKLPLTYQWNISLEQPIGRSQSLSLTYIGKLYGINEPSPRMRDQSLPDRNAGLHRV
jgi:hypothetical protein